mmetsp:Transcript_2656/g.3823  ORF Transcript_2656/g.3823 Transcript_2656/m.3823 type:complete len:245 (-) Transcript_2656:58-792(-)
MYLQRPTGTHNRKPIRPRKTKKATAQITTTINLSVAKRRAREANSFLARVILPPSSSISWLIFFNCSFCALMTAKLSALTSMASSALPIILSINLIHLSCSAKTSLNNSCSNFSSFTTFRPESSSSITIVSEVGLSFFLLGASFSFVSAGPIILSRLAWRLATLNWANNLFISSICCFFFPSHSALAAGCKFFNSRLNRLKLSRKSLNDLLMSSINCSRSSPSVLLIFNIFRLISSFISFNLLS